MLPGELGSVNVDIAGGWEGNLQVGGDWYRSTVRKEGFCGLAKAKGGQSGEYDT